MSMAVAGVNHWLKAAKKRSNCAAVPGLRLRPTPCGSSGVQDLTRHGTLVAQASPTDIISHGEGGSAYCGALVMRSSGVRMSIGINSSVLESFVGSKSRIKFDPPTSCWGSLLRAAGATAVLRRHD